MAAIAGPHAGDTGATALITSTDRVSEEIARATARIGQIKARQLLREMRAQSVAKIKARKAEQKRRFELGGAVIAAGLGEWEPAEITGLLLDGKQRVGHSPTLRLAMRKKGQGQDLDTLAVSSS